MGKGGGGRWRAKCGAGTGHVLLLLLAGRGKGRLAVTLGDGRCSSPCPLAARRCLTTSARWYLGPVSCQGAGSDWDRWSMGRPVLSVGVCVGSSGVGLWSVFHL